MKGGIVLAVELAEIKLAYEFNNENVVAAFEDDDGQYDHTFGQAMTLFAPTLGPSGLWLLKKFDEAGMDLDEMASVIWGVAREYYETNLKNKEDEQ